MHTQIIYPVNIVNPSKAQIKLLDQRVDQCMDKEGRKRFMTLRQLQRLYYWQLNLPFTYMDAYKHLLSYEDWKWYKDMEKKIEEIH